MWKCECFYVTQFGITQTVHYLIIEKGGMVIRDNELFVQIWFCLLQPFIYYLLSTSMFIFSNSPFRIVQTLWLQMTH